MLCHFCQDLVFVPVEEVWVQHAYWLRDPSFVYSREKELVSVHQPSRTALELSASRGCRVCALFWFQLFQNNWSAYTRRDNDHEIAPVLLSMGQLSADKELKAQYSEWDGMKLRCGEELVSLRIHKPISGITDEHVS